MKCFMRHGLQNALAILIERSYTNSFDSNASEEKMFARTVRGKVP